MKINVGLDLGVGSVGWAVVGLDPETGDKHILGMGSRIIPLSTDDADEFSKGNAITKNQKRTLKRTQRKGYDRYQLRRKYLKAELERQGMLPEGNLMELTSLELYGLRDRALKEKISLSELGRILYHLNQKRGYKSSRSDANLDKKDTEYVAEVKTRHQLLRDKGLTIGQYFYTELGRDTHFQVKKKVFPREAYVEEFDSICAFQKQFHKELSDELIGRLRNEIIFYQRKLKSQKGLVSVCEFEGFVANDKNGKAVFVGPRVAPRSSPIFQVGRIWEAINAITITNKQNERLNIKPEKKQEIFEYLNKHEKLSEAKLFEILGIKKNDGWHGDKNLVRGVTGNLPRVMLANILGSDNALLGFDLEIKEKPGDAYLVDRKGGEVKGSEKILEVAPGFESQPLYRLWHTIYSINDPDECATALIRNFDLDADVAGKLASIDMTRLGFGNKSAKAIRKILPYLMMGYVYSDAASLAGYNHSNSLTKDERLARALMDKLPILPKNSLRQPVVEKILNQMIHVVNGIIEKFGKPDEIRVELARELKQSKDERNETFKNLNKIERENELIRKRIEEEYAALGVRATRKNVIKWRLFQEMNNQESRINAVCVYCGQPFSLADTLRGNSVDVEHIIPKSLLFDDSQSNKTLSHRTCNENKGDKTAYDYMQGKGEQQFQEYLERIEYLYKNQVIGKGKRNKLLTPADKIPKDFIERQLRETQYIARKSKEVLEQVCNNVWSTSGSVTSYLRRLWGWDDVLMNLQLPRYRELGLTEWVDVETNGQKHKKEVIRGWTKRDDHRHHAIDALVVACTQQGYIQKLNTLSARKTRDELYAAVGKENNRSGLSLLDKYVIAQRPFATTEVEQQAAGVLVSFKAGKKVAAWGKRKVKKDGRNVIVQDKIIVPRGALSEESVYGRINRLVRQVPLKELFANPDLIVKPKVKALIVERLTQHGGDAKKALQSLRKDPIYYHAEKGVLLEYGSMYKPEYVLKYPVEGIKVKDLDYVVDPGVRAALESRLAHYDFNPKEAFKDLDNNPVWFNKEKKIPIRTVRLFTGLNAVEPVARDAQGRDIGFVKPGNNHHVAIYVNEQGKFVEHLCSFWHAVERKKYRLPVVIKDPGVVWDKVLETPDAYPQSFLEKLPERTLKFHLSLQQNEMFLLGLDREVLENAIANADFLMLSPHLYRVQKLTASDYWFRLHTETQLVDTEESKLARRFYRFKSIGALGLCNPVKVRIGVSGNIVYNSD